MDGTVTFPGTRNGKRMENGSNGLMRIRNRKDGERIEPIKTDQKQKDKEQLNKQKQQTETATKTQKRTTQAQKRINRWVRL
jgi:hypothetical protein